MRAGLLAAAESADIFERSGMVRAMAGSRWITATLDPGCFGAESLGAHALRDLKGMEPDPAVRLGALPRSPIRNTIGSA